MRQPKFALRSLLAFVTFACIALTAWHFLIERPRQLRAQRNAAIDAICTKGVDLHRVAADNIYAVFFKNKNVVDEDLQQFVPVFRQPGGWVVGSTPVRRLYLNGSLVSTESVEKFERASGIEVRLDGDR